MTSCLSPETKVRAKRDSVRLWRAYDEMMSNVDTKTAELSKKGIDVITVDKDFFSGSAKVGRSVYDPRQKYYFYFPNTDVIKEQKLNPSKWTFFCSKEKLTENPIYGNPVYLPYGKRGKGGYGLVGESDGIHQEPFDQFMSTNYVSFQNFSNSDQNKILTEVEKKSVKEITETAKKVCEDFGYKPGTDKFADCAKEIYLKEIEQIETSTVVVQRNR